MRKSGLGLDQDWYPHQERSRKAGVVTCIFTALLLASSPINAMVPALRGQRVLVSPGDACSQGHSGCDWSYSGDPYSPGPTISLRSGHCWSHLADEEVKDQRNEVTGLRSHG